jgi:hypothetical protein
MKLFLSLRLKTICLLKWNQLISSSLNSNNKLSRSANLPSSKTSSLDPLSINKMTTTFSKSSNPMCKTTSILRMNLLLSLHHSTS